MHPPLRQFLEDRVGGFAMEALDLERHETPLEIEGRLMADAYADRCRRRAARAGRSRVGRRVPRAGGGRCVDHRPWIAWRRARSTSGGPVARFARWRSCDGRPRYLNAGVPDQERMLARRGMSLVGTVKSAALVQVVGRGSWIDETASAIRSAVRGAINRHVGSRDPQSAAIAVAILIGDRGALDPIGRAAAAGSRHVSRHRHLRRQHRDPRRPGPRTAVGDSHSRRLGGRRRHRAAGGVCLHRRRRSIGDARDGDGGDLPRAARHRSANGADACDGRHARRRPDRLAVVDRRRRPVAHVRRHGGDRGGRVTHHAAGRRRGCRRRWRWCSRPSRPRSH